MTPPSEQLSKRVLKMDVGDKIICPWTDMGYVKATIKRLRTQKSREHQVTELWGDSPIRLEVERIA